MENTKYIIGPNELHIELLQESHAEKLFELVNDNRDHLRQWLGFIDNMKGPEFALAFIKGSMQRCQAGQEYAYLIFEKNLPVGRIGLYKIDGQNKIGEIGYWLITSAEGRGIASLCCEMMISFAFEKLNLHRLEIKCAMGNIKSQAIPVRLNFLQEGVLRQAEWLNGSNQDLILYSLLKEESNKNQ